jgi:SAM-dependent methyltransferase
MGGSVRNDCCPACDADTRSRFAELATPYLDRRERYEIVTCTACGHGRALGRHDPGFLAAIYSGDFFQSSQQSSGDPDSPIEVNARARVDDLRRRARGRLLDIGAGTGVFLRAARQYFEVEGIEYSEAAGSMARAAGLNVHIGDMLSVDLPAGRFDVVTLWDVLASLPDPAAAIARCRTLLKPGGLLVLTLPMIDSTAARLAGKAWPLLIPPVNLHYFTKASISHICNRAGFDMISLAYPGKRVSLRFVVQKASRSVGLHAVGERVAPFIPALGVPLNTRDIATVNLRSTATSSA